MHAAHCVRTNFCIQSSEEYRVYKKYTGTSRLNIEVFCQRLELSSITFFIHDLVYNIDFLPLALSRI